MGKTQNCSSCKWSSSQEKAAVNTAVAGAMTENTNPDHSLLRVSYKKTEAEEDDASWKQMAAAVLSPMTTANSARTAAGNMTAEIPLQPQGSVTVPTRENARPPPGSVPRGSSYTGSLERYCFEGDWFRDIHLDSSPLVIEDGSYDPPPMHLLGPPTCPCSSNDSSLSPAPAILKPNSSCSDNSRGPEAGLVRERPKVLNIVPHSKPVIKPSLVTNSLRGGVSSGMFIIN